MADPPSEKFQMLEELTRRQKALLAGMQAEALYPEPPSAVGDFERDARIPAHDHDGIMDMSDARPEFSEVTTNRYRYKPEFRGAPGAGGGTYEGPMAQDLEHIPGVVSEGPDGMKRVDPGRLSMANASATGENSREIERLRKRLDALSGATSSGNEEDTLETALSGRY